MKVRLYNTILLNLLLWSSETWSRNVADIYKCEAFYHKAMRRILGISMMQVKEDEIKNEETRKRFMNSEGFADIWRCRQMLFLGRITRLNIYKYPFILLTASVHR